MVIVLTMLTTGIGIYLVYSQYQVVRMGYVIDKDLLEYRREMEIKKRLPATSTRKLCLCLRRSIFR
jgi:hypothetical protein